MKSKDQQILEEKYNEVLQKNELTITFLSRYNGWILSNRDNKLEDKLTEMGSKFYDKDGDAYDYPSKEDVELVVSNYYGKPINFNYVVNEADS